MGGGVRGEGTAFPGRLPPPPAASQRVRLPRDTLRSPRCVQLPAAPCVAPGVHSSHECTRRSPGRVQSRCLHPRGCTLLQMHPLLETERTEKSEKRTLPNLARSLLPSDLCAPSPGISPPPLSI
ncbi:hypothetical protein NDU88_002368 [Pleurodeles waltl]|uniref:Uncharacterized protein n=1 Tax=Pleurodeles waltl TaxID=8319 RepID=A0AAV7MX66_PLEWA|nr:hypothetical protein NDU88_002368 [Pleurodeles waltl]